MELYRDYELEAFIKMYVDLISLYKVQKTVVMDLLGFKWAQFSLIFMGTPKPWIIIRNKSWNSLKSVVYMYEWIHKSTPKWTLKIGNPWKVAHNLLLLLSVSIK